MVDADVSTVTGSPAINERRMQSALAGSTLTSAA
jgi:hypothetical protein